MNSEINRIKKIVGSLEKNDAHMQITLLDELIECAQVYKKSLMDSNLERAVSTIEKHDNSSLKVEKISQETFLYKPVTTKNYYDGNYLENFSSMRTSDLQSSEALEIHNKFWEAHEVYGGNIFATIPLGLINDLKASRLEKLNWKKVEVDIYEVKLDPGQQLPKYKLINAAGKMFDQYLLIREVYGDILMILHYNL